DLQNEPARLRRVDDAHRVTDAPEAQSLQRQRLLLVEPDSAPDLRHAKTLRRCRHDPHARISSRSLPRMRGTSEGSFTWVRASNAARTTLCAWAEPSDFVSTL